MSSRSGGRIPRVGLFAGLNSDDSSEDEGFTFLSDPFKKGKKRNRKAVGGETDNRILPKETPTLQVLALLSLPIISLVNAAVRSANPPRSSSQTS